MLNPASPFFLFLFSSHCEKIVTNKLRAQFQNNSNRKSNNDGAGSITPVIQDPAFFLKVFVLSIVRIGFLNYSGWCYGASQIKRKRKRKRKNEKEKEPYCFMSIHRRKHNENNVSMIVYCNKNIIENIFFLGALQFFDFHDTTYHYDRTTLNRFNKRGHRKQHRDFDGSPFR